jgi:hypothetical protein
MGTSNNTARALAIPLDPAAAVAVIASGVPAAIDAGLVTPTGDQAQTDTAPARRNWLARLLRRGTHSERQADTTNSLYFLHAATVGLNVEFARLATARSRRAALGGLTYPAPSFEALLHLRPVTVSVQLSGVAVRTGSARSDTESDAELLLAGDVLQLAVVNTPVFGGSLNLRLPRVDAHDHLLDVVLVEPPRLNNVSQIVEKLRLPLRPLRHPQPPPADQEQEAGSRPASGPYVDVLLPGVRRYQARGLYRDGRAGGRDTRWRGTGTYPDRHSCCAGCGRRLAAPGAGERAGWKQRRGVQRGAHEDAIVVTLLRSTLPR